MRPVMWLPPIRIILVRRRSTDHEPVNDSRDAGQAERLQAVSLLEVATIATPQQGCAQFCPNELNPTLSISGLKRATAKSLLRWGW